MKYLLYKDFLDSLKRLDRKGSTFESAYHKAKSPYLSIGDGLEFDDAFKGLKITNHGETRIKHSIKFDLGRACRMVIIKNQNICLFLYAGVHEDVEKWLDKNRGFKTVIDNNTSEIKILFKSERGVVDDPIVDRSLEVFKLSQNLSGDDQSFLFRELDSKVIISLFNLNSRDTDEKIWSVVSDIEDADMANSLYNILIRLREPKKNSRNIKALISDLRGELKPVENAIDDNIEIDGGDEVKIINLNSFDSETTRKTLDHKDFRSWMLFMHPNQDKLVEEDFNGPALLKGVSGSGKTAVVVNRALRLAKKYPDEQIAILTLNKALAKLIDDLVSSAGDGLKNLSAISFWQLCKNQLGQFEPLNDRHYDEETWRSEENIDDIWEEYYHQELNWNGADVMFPVHQSLLQNDIFPEEYIREEFDFIRSALPAEERQDYLKMKREGRAFALQENFREMILKGLESWESKMGTIGAIDYVGVTSKLYQYIDQINPSYRAILVDEMQDFGTLELKIIRKLVLNDKNDLFLAGDNAQRVLTKQHNFKLAGINTDNRSYKIYQNYRNTKEILDAANNILEENFTGTGNWVTDIDILQPEFAGSSNYLPFVYKATTLSDELTYAIQYIQSILIANTSENEDTETACIAIAGFHLSDLKGLAKELKIQLLDGTIKLENKKIFLSDLEQTKGFEFDHMVIVNCCNGTLPNPDLPEQEAFRDLSRFYVAMTRARKNLIISYHGELSSFVQSSVENFFLTDDWNEIVDLKLKPVISAINESGKSERFQQGLNRYANYKDYGTLNGLKLLLTRKAIGMSKERQDKLIKYITGIRKKSQSARDASWRNLNELFSDQQVVINAILAGGFEDVAGEVNYFKELFEIDDRPQENTPKTIQEFGEAINNKNHGDELKRNWNVILHKTGLCMHCGEPALRGDYVCYACNPG